MLKDIHGRDINLPFPGSVTADIRGLETLLQRPHFEGAQAEYERRRRQRKRTSFYAFWEGPANLEQLARHLGRAVQYEFFYRTWSQTAHGEDLSRQLVGEGGVPGVEVFRNPKDVKFMYNSSFTFGLATIRLLLTRYRPEEVDGGTMERWYRREVRTTYLKLLEDNE